MNIDITVAEKREIWAVAKELYKFKHPSSIEKYGWDGKHPVLRDYEGFLGELAVAKYFGVEYAPSIYEWKGDEGYDLLVDDVRVGVKATTFQPKPPLVVKVKEKKADVYYLVELFKKTGKVNIAGWLDINSIVVKEPRKLHKKGPMNHIVPYDELNAVLTTPQECVKV